VAAVCAVITTLTLFAGQVTPAHAAWSARADVSDGPIDVLGIGSSSLQYAIDFVANGDPTSAIGYNGAFNAYRVEGLDATADSNGRGSWAYGSTPTSPSWLYPSSIYREQAVPIQRTDGSDAATAALLSAGTAFRYFNFITTTDLTAADVTALDSALGGTPSLEVFKFGTVHLGMIGATATNAPAGLSVNELADIYDCADTTWSSLGATGSNASDTIIPIMPPTWSDETFLHDLQAVSGFTGLGPCVRYAQENDPTAITSCTPSCSANAIEPMSSAIWDLWFGLSGNSSYGSGLATGTGSGHGYFEDPTADYPGGSAITPGVKQLNGTPIDGNPVYNQAHNADIVYPISDQNSATTWQPGESAGLNWARTLFCKSVSTDPVYFQTAPAWNLLADAGVDPSSQSCTQQ
jgi:hypothetical protein